MEQEDLGRAEVMSVAEAIALPVDKPDGYHSESEESEFSMSDSVHYTDSELDSDGDCSNDDCNFCEPKEKAPVVPAEPPRRLTTAEIVRTHLTCRTLSKINYGPYRIFFDIEIDNDFLGRIIIQLGNDDEKCRKNFDRLCKGTMSLKNNLHRHFSGTKIHRMEDGKFLEGGVLKPLSPKKAESLYKEKPVLDGVCYDSYIMVANKNVDDAYCGARFLLTTTANVMHYDPDHVPVGCVVTGTDVIDSLAKLPRNNQGFFIPSITIAHCGSIKKTREEHMRTGKYEKVSKNSKYSYPYKMHERIIRATARNIQGSSRALREAEEDKD